jgi:hypothetical protein
LEEHRLSLLQYSELRCIVDFARLLVTFYILPRHNIPNMATLLDCGLRRLVDGRTESHVFSTVLWGPCISVLLLVALRRFTRLGKSYFCTMDKCAKRHNLVYSNDQHTAHRRQRAILVTKLFSTNLWGTRVTLAQSPRLGKNLVLWITVGFRTRFVQNIVCRV